MEKRLASEFQDQSIFRLNENLPRIKNCLDRLTEAEVWQQPNSSSNSIANLILHLCGNIHQYIMSSLGETEDIRVRDLEFSTRGGFSKEELFSKIEQVISNASQVIQQAAEEQLLRKREVQGFNFSGIGIIVHVVEHLSYHTGQIALLTKLLKNEDLGFYKDFDLNIKNKEQD